MHAMSLSLEDTVADTIVECQSKKDLDLTDSKNKNLVSSPSASLSNDLESISINRDRGISSIPSAPSIKYEYIEVIDPKREKAHIEYTVRSKLLGSYKVNEVKRKFRDFEWLHQQISKKYKGCLIPILPEKSILNNFNSFFLESQRQSLQAFLIKLHDHPLICNAVSLKIFLTSTSRETLLTQIPSATDLTVPSPLPLGTNFQDLKSQLIVLDKQVETARRSCDDIKNWSHSISKNYLLAKKKFENIQNSEEVVRTSFFNFSDSIQEFESKLKKLESIDNVLNKYDSIYDKLNCNSKDKTSPTETSQKETTETTQNNFSLTIPSDIFENISFSKSTKDNNNNSLVTTLSNYSKTFMAVENMARGVENQLSIVTEVRAEFQRCAKNDFCDFSKGSINIEGESVIEDTSISTAFQLLRAECNTLQTVVKRVHAEVITLVKKQQNDFKKSLIDTARKS